MVVATLSTKGQVVIPADVRRRVGLSSGDQVILEVDEAGKSITLRREPTWGELAAQFTKLVKPDTPLLESASDFYTTRQPRLP